MKREVDGAGVWGDFLACSLLDFGAQSPNSFCPCPTGEGKLGNWFSVAKKFLFHQESSGLLPDLLKKNGESTPRQPGISEWGSGGFHLGTFWIWGNISDFRNTISGFYLNLVVEQENLQCWPCRSSCRFPPHPPPALGIFQKEFLWHHLPWQWIFLTSDLLGFLLGEKVPDPREASHTKNSFISRGLLPETLQVN